MSDDRALRERALDVAQSFIVQAPAGSGKTELLIQRYLALLARVERPEQVVAITFTRKAAAEMRRRVLTALAEADAGTRPREPHRRITLDLATAALTRSRQLDWSVELQPQRLCIDTLDAMNARLAQHLPVLAGGIGGAKLVENAAAYYAMAIQRMLGSLGAGDELEAAVTRLLRAVDNNAARLERMLAELLPTRDQWLPYLAAGADDALRAMLEAALRRLIDEALRAVADEFPPGFADAVDPLLRHAAAAADDPGKAAAFALWRRPETALEPRADCLDAWRALPELLLTRAKAGWKQRLTSREGFGPEHGRARERFKALVAAHERNEALRTAIQGLRALPPSSYGAADWELIAALRHTLRHLVAELKVVFAEHRCADFVELALSAQQALGEVDDPSELLLALDRRIQHVLVDEFQDTSHTQLRLLRLLTAGWQAGDGRTLFLVGDPMQSIYRFRHADMSLFLKTKAQGIGNVELASLVLDSNYRSAPAIVSWVNETFARIFPAADDMGSGAARFQACRATRTSAASQGVNWHALTGESPTAEVARVTEILRAEQNANPHGSIAILVRSRSHLTGLQEQLRAHGMAAHAVELESPSRQQVVQDLIGLTRALCHAGDRVAWLGVLRAPWCGLSWQDLERIAATGPDHTIWDLVQDGAVVERLTADGRERLLRTRAVLSAALDRRALQPFELWIERTWHALGGRACIEFADEHASADRFFATLASVASHGDVDDPAALADSFTEPYGQGEPPREAGIEIMTIHRAKGLEFDTVILLGLARQPRSDSAKGLYWLERTADDGSEDLLLAPLAGTADGGGLLIDFIKRADAVRDRAESVRLLYVATTRARQRLHLVAQCKPGARQAPAMSLLEHLWSDAARHFPPADEQDAVAEQVCEAIEPTLRRLRELPRLEVGRDDSPTAPLRPEFVWAGFAAAQVGTIVHAVLRDIGVAGLSGWTREAVQRRRARFRRELALLGVDDSELEASAQRVVDALCAVLDDAKGRWLLTAKLQAASELPLTVQANNRLEHVRIDRTFVDENGVRWIIDFKTSVHEGGDLEAFLDAEVARYRGQLRRYAQVMSRLEQRPIRVGLYFPLLQAFRSWSPLGEERGEETCGPRTPGP